ncbi:hypothetical protein [Solibacillus sp. R5-41]|nr:hypothetical protein [Solibacillus sp. R5-41]
MDGVEDNAAFELSQAECPMILNPSLAINRKALSSYGLEPETKELF